MLFKVQVGPAQIAIHQGQTVLLTETDGRVNWPSKSGLYFRDTRVISAWAIYANGELWDEQPCACQPVGRVARLCARFSDSERDAVTHEARLIHCRAADRYGDPSARRYPLASSEP